MIPIFEQVNNQGIGYGYREFSERFDQICREHLRDKRAAAFAFIFYDFNGPMRKLLKDNKVFTHLDRLAGKDLSVFFLNAPSSHESTARFTTEFANALGLKSELFLPCIVFFRAGEDEQGQPVAEDFVIGSLPDHEVIAYQQLYRFIENYVKGSAKEDKDQPTSGDGRFHWLTIAGRFVSLEIIKDAIQTMIERIFS